MTPDVSIWLVIVLALVAANLPFANERLLAVVPLPGRHKALGWRLLELLLWYFVVGAVGMALEKPAGQNYPQGWEFYAVTGCLFLTLAFPGFVYRYLVRHRGRAAPWT
jgi:hypothetical protein